MTKVKKKTTDTAVQLKLKGDQAWLVRDALESTARMVIGQPSDMLEQVFNKEGKRCYFDYEERVLIERLATSLMGLSGSATGGVGWNDEGDILWDMCQVVRHRLAWDHAIKENLVDEHGGRDWRTMMGVHYDEPMGHGSEPLAEISGKDGDYVLILNSRQATLLERALRTTLSASVCRFDLASEWPKARNNVELFEAARNKLKEAMEEVACAHIGISHEERPGPEKSPIFGDISSIISSMNPSPQRPMSLDIN